MSKQLAISSAFAVFAMASLVLMNAGDKSGARSGGDPAIFAIPAEASFAPPRPILQFD